MEQDYKGHLITALAWRNTDGEWKPDVQVTDLSEDNPSVKPLTSGKKYATEEEAEHAGLSFAKKWIDDGKPNLGPRA